MSQGRIVRIERDIMEKNNAYANSNRAYLVGLHTLALNFVSSPGSGKTSLLVRAINDLKSRFPIAVIEGDQQTAHDAERIRATGVRAVQINTGKGCHLDAHMVAHALDELALDPDGLLFIENVGNLICPAGFDLGEAHKVVVLSVTEGEDKPLKYPDMFAAADLMLLNKSDLLPHLDFDVGAMPCPCAAGQSEPADARRLGAHRRGHGGAVRVDRKPRGPARPGAQPHRCAGCTERRRARSSGVNRWRFRTPPLSTITGRCACGCACAALCRA